MSLVGYVALAVLLVTTLRFWFVSLRWVIEARSREAEALRARREACEQTIETLEMIRDHRASLAEWLP